MLKVLSFDLASPTINQFLTQYFLTQPVSNKVESLSRVSRLHIVVFTSCNSKSYSSLSLNLIPDLLNKRHLNRCCGYHDMAQVGGWAFTLLFSISSKGEADLISPYQTNSLSALLRLLQLSKKLVSFNLFLGYHFNSEQNNP